MKIKLLLLVGLAACSGRAEPLFLISSHQPNGIYKVDPSGRVVWRCADIRHPQDLDVSDDGNIFCSEIPGAKMISRDGKLLWRYDVPDGCQNPVAQILGNGRFLVGNEGPGRLLEIDASGKTLKAVPLSPKDNRHHGQFRFCRKTPQGTYLVPMTADGVVHEVDSAGSMVRDFGSFRTPVSAVRLNNGHTLIGSFRRLDEFDKDGRLVWSFNPVADGHLPEGKGGHVCGIQPLEDGDIAFAFYHANADWPDIIVVTRNKQVRVSIVLPAIDKVAGLRVVED